MLLKRSENGLLSFPRVKSEFTLGKPPVYPTETQSLPGAKSEAFGLIFLLSLFFAFYLKSYQFFLVIPKIMANFVPSFIKHEGNDDER